MKKCVIYTLIVAMLSNTALFFREVRNKIIDGNCFIYSVALSKKDGNSMLKGKNIIFLGSSVTYGSASKGESFVDYLAKIDGVNALKEAVSGTTLADINDTSYIARMKKIDKSFKADAFVCQLSTNDAKAGITLGKISESFNEESFDAKTVAGAIEYVISYAKRTWNCPVVFYTGTKWDSEMYGEMIELLYQIQKKWNIGILDLWNDAEMNSVSKSDYDFYMENSIHPKKAGYKLWWLPKFESYFENMFSE